MKKTFAYAISGIAGALALGMVATAPAQARPVAAGPVIDVQADIVLAGQRRQYGNQGRRGHQGQQSHRGQRGQHGKPYYGGWRQSNWHQRRYNQNRNYRYGPNYRHGNYGNVRPFANFIRALAHAGYRNFRQPVFHGQGRNWTPHYFVSGYDGHGRGVNLRVCAYTGKVLGWQYY